MSAKKWNFYYDKNQYGFTTNQIVDNVSLWVAIGLLWFSFLRMIEEHFPKFISYEIYVYDTESYSTPSLVTKAIGLDWKILILFLVLLWLPGSGFLTGKGKRWSWIFTAGAMAIPILYIVIYAEKISEGMQTIAYLYMKQFNPYHGTNITIPAGNLECGPYCLSVILMVLWLAIWGIAKLVKKRVALVLFPLTALLIEFLVGISPAGSSMALLFVAAFLLLIPRGTKLWKHAVVLVAVIISVLISGVAFDENIEFLSSDRKIADRLIEQVNFSSIEFEKLFDIAFQVKNESLSNNQPKYTGNIVLEIVADERPDSKIYLRGYCGTDYINGNWTWDTSVFENACNSAGYSSETVAKELSRMPYLTVKEESSGGGNSMEIEISYVGTAGNIAYVPYNADCITFDDDYQFVGDFLIKKTIGDTRISVVVDAGGDLTSAGLYVFSARKLSGYKNVEWYNNVAMAYGESVTELDCIKDAAAYVKSKVEYPSEYNLMLQGSVAYNPATLPVILKNWYRMKLAEEVRDYLAANMSYSVILDNLPWGADPVEYALTVGHEGYCMHYASAAALILKELGVPTRYVSGYVVRPSDFTYDTVADGYCAMVPDYNAHAWVEIYMDDVGWVPFEMTEGYSSDSGTIPTQVPPEKWEQFSEAFRNRLENNSQETESERVTQSETPTQSEGEPTESEEPSQTESEPTESESESEIEPTETEKPTETEAESESESDGTGGNGTTGTGTSDGNDSDGSIPEGLKIFIFIVAGFLILVGIVYATRVRDAVFARNLKRLMDKEYTRRAVRQMNRRVYRQLRWKHSGYLNDEQYLQALIENYKVFEPEKWERYMEIVKRMHYSHEDITVEEMMHCYWCYKAVAPVRYGKS